MKEQENDSVYKIAFRYFEGSLIPEEEKILFDFLREKDSNMQLFRHWEEEWYASAQKSLYIENKWNRLSGRLQMQSTGTVRPRKMYIIGKKVLPYAAIFILGLVCSTFILGLYEISMREKGKLAQTEFSVPIGSQSRVLLPDSSVVWLNAGSTLKYDRTFGKETRAVYIEGEGMFDVTKNKDIPFIVKNQKMEVTVHGTVFNVKSFEEDSVSLVELMQGSVSVAYPFTSAETTLIPGERLVLNNIKKVVKKETFDVESHLSWHDGILAFCDEPLSVIVKKLERRFGIHITIKTKALNSRRYYLTFVNNETIDQILDKMKEDTTLHIKKNNNQIEIY